MRKKTSLNQTWQFMKEYEETVFVPLESQGESIHLPHTHEVLPYNNFDETCYQYVSNYKKYFEYELKKSKRLLLHFEGVMTCANVFLNGTYLGEHKGGYTPFSFDITETVKHKNVLVVIVDGRERSDIPPYGFVVDYLGYAGIYRDVYLEEVNDVYLDCAKTSSEDVLGAHPVLKSNIEVIIHTTDILDAKVSMHLKNKETKETIATETNVIDRANQRINSDIRLLIPKGKLRLWHIDDPYLYEVNFEIFIEDQLVDSYTHDFGFRETIFRADGFYLNGEKLILKGLNRHQSFPYVGYAMPKRSQEDDADFLKNTLQLNMVRTSHYPQSTYFLDACDRLGLLVFEELPGWQHIGDEAWQEVALKNIEEMILRDYNHASIVLWGVRINESGDHHDFYTKTNDLSHSLDTTRQTAGVRCITNSEFLEDVYTFNDFILGDPHDTDQRILRPQLEVTGLEEPVPYLISEYNGHLYPTKRFDQITRQEEHVRRHLEVMNATALMPNISGSIGWCAFDYNTHYQFGSSDRICYHGVMDMFRIPKFAAYAYSSQVSPEKKIVMEPVLVYGMGEKNYGGVTPMTILTNVDYIEYFIDGKKFGRYYKATDRYPGLDYPPVVIEGITDVWGAGFEDISLVGYMKDQVVIRKDYVKNPVYSDVKVVIDHDELCAGMADATRVTLEAVDQIGNRINYSDTVIAIEVEGPGEVIGPKFFPLIGGCRSFWVKTKFEKGAIKLKVKDVSMNYEKNLEIEVK